MINQSRSDGVPSEEPGGFQVTGRQVVGGLIAVLLIVFIGFNSETTPVSLIFFTVTLPLWIVLAGTALLGVGIGMLLGGRRAKRKYRQH